jgi:drug/metabolite transporter (DMT)-like permease
VAIVLSLLAAAAYGVSDFVGGVFSKRVSPWSVAFVGALAGSAVVAAFAAVDGGDPQRADYAWGLLAGVGNGLGTAFLYRGLSSGRMGVVAPVSGVGAALLPVVVGLVSGERPGPVVWMGMLVALPAIWLVASEPAVTETAGPRSGLSDGVLAGLGFGTLFAALAQIPEESGFLPLAFNQLVAAVLIAVVAGALRSAWVPRERAAYAGVISGSLGALATGLFLIATHEGYLTVSAVIVSLYPAFTVLLAFSVLREHVHRIQGLGLALCAVAVALVAGG